MRWLEDGSDEPPGAYLEIIDKGRRPLYFATGLRGVEVSSTRQVRVARAGGDTPCTTSVDEDDGPRQEQLQARHARTHTGPVHASESRLIYKCLTASSMRVSDR